MELKSSISSLFLHAGKDLKASTNQRRQPVPLLLTANIYYRKDQKKISKRYAAEYRDVDGKQVCHNLGTKNRTKARRTAIEIQQRLESGMERKPPAKHEITNLIEQYKEAAKIRGLAPKTISKYKADFEKLERFCKEQKIKLSRQFTERDLYQYRIWLYDQEFADKTVQGAVILAKQLFKWAWKQKLVSDYQLAAVSFPKARAKEQPCFNSEQADAIINKATGEEKLAFALLAYAGLRIGEVEQLHWEDIKADNGKYKMIHIRKGGSNGTTKDKDERFVPVHPTVARYLGPAIERTGMVFKNITERKLLGRVKKLSHLCGFTNPEKYKLHSFRHHFASLCANRRVAERKALSWLGHSSSKMLELYYHLNDDESQKAMMALANQSIIRGSFEAQQSPYEGNLRAIRQSKIEKTLQVPEVKKLVTSLSHITERAGFEPAVRVYTRTTV
jgi:integrase/recombinase XerD